MIVDFKDETIDDNERQPTMRQPMTEDETSMNGSVDFSQ